MNTTTKMELCFHQSVMTANIYFSKTGFQEFHKGLYIRTLKYALQKW